jgi:hypothetical protein
MLKGFVSLERLPRGIQSGKELATTGRCVSTAYGKYGRCGVAALLVLASAIRTRSMESAQEKDVFRATQENGLRVVIQPVKRRRFISRLTNPMDWLWSISVCRVTIARITWRGTPSGPPSFPEMTRRCVRLRRPLSHHSLFRTCG